MYDLSTGVKVIKIGSCTVDPGNAFSPMHVRLKRQTGIGGGSTVTLLRDDNDLLLVDTGYDREDDLSAENSELNWTLLQRCLEAIGVAPAEITKVFVTHFHLDHFGGIEHLSQAEWYCTRPALADYGGPAKERFIPLDEGDQILKNAVILYTPGHTRGHGSILLNPDKSPRIAVCGDAIINLAWLQSGHIWRFNSDFFDGEAAKKSISMLLGESDLVIPGHGEPFFSTPKLRKL